MAYAAWAGKGLPTEAEWERARSGVDRARFAWGDDETVDGRWMASTWQGEFPWQNLALDGHVGTSPVGTFPPNGYGLLDMIGKVCEWTRGAAPGERASCCAPRPASARSGRRASMLSRT